MTASDRCAAPNDFGARSFSRADRLEPCLQNAALAGLDVAEDLLAKVEIGRAFVGETERARRAVKQPDAEPRLQFADVARDQRARQPNWLAAMVKEPARTTRTKLSMVRKRSMRSF